MTLTRKFLRTEQTVPVATVAAPGALFFDSVTHIGTNSEALERNDATLVPWTLATDPTSKMESVIVYLIVTGVGGGGVDYAIQGSADGTNYANLSVGTIAANGTTAVTVANADLVRVGAFVNAGAGSAGNLVVFVTGLRRMYDRPTWEQ